MAQRQNPYIAGAPVTETSMFFGREDVFSWIERSLTGEFSDHVLVIHGQRRVGKTSVLKQLPNRLPDTYLPFFIDLQGRVNTSLGRFLWWLARQISKFVKEETGNEIELPERKAFQEDPEQFETSFIPSVAVALGERRLLLTFDEFDSLENSGEQDTLALPLMEILTRLMDHKKLNFIYSVGSAGQKLENREADYTAFFKQALYRKVSFLNEENAQSLIVNPVKDRVDYHPKAVQRIVAITSGHPYYVQLVCHEIFSECQKNDSWLVSEKMVNSLLPSVVERGTVNLKFIWDESSALEKWIMTILSKHPEAKSAKIQAELRKEKVAFSSQDFANALLQLQERDVLTKNNTFLIHLFDLWLQENRPIEYVRQELEAEKLSSLLVKTEQLERLERYTEALALLEEYLSISPDALETQQQRLLSLREKTAEEKQQKRKGLSRNLAIAGVGLLSVFVAYNYISSLQNADLPVDATTNEPQAAVAEDEPTLVPTAGPTAIPLAWTRVDSAQFIQRDTVTSIQMDPEDNEILYAATLNGGVYKTIDGGVSWQPANIGIEGLEILALEIDPADRNRIVLASKDDISISLDGAASWEKVGIIRLIKSPYNANLSISFDPDRSGNFFLGERNNLLQIFENGGNRYVYEPLDADGSEAAASAPPCIQNPRYIKNDPIDPNVFYAIEEFSTEVISEIPGEPNLIRECESGFYVSRDGGKSWREKATIDEQMLLNARIISAELDGTSYVLFSSTQALYLSTDTGSSWQKLSNFACNPLEIDSNDPSNIYCYGGPDQLAEAIYRTANGGETWQRLTTQPALPTGLQISSTNPENLFISSSGVHKSTDAGQNWSTVSSGFGSALYELSIINSVLYAYEYEQDCDHIDSNIYKSADGGNNWTLLSDEGCGFWVDADDLVFYRIQSVENAVDSLLVSRDEGNSWTVIDTPLSSIGGLGTHPTVSGLITAVERTDPHSMRRGDTVDATAIYSSDFGSSWQFADGLASLDNFSGATRTIFGFHSDSKAYMVEQVRRNLIVSNNMGADWEPYFCANLDGKKIGDAELFMRLSPGDTVAAIHPQDENIIFVATRGIGIVKSMDGCKNWTPANDGLNNLYVSSIAINPENPDIIYAGTDGGAYISFDGGDNWGPINEGFLGSSVVYSIVIDPLNPSTVFAATPSGIYRLDQ